MTEKMVNQMHDPKGPLKGKGVNLAQWARDASDRLAQIRRQMHELAQQTREVEGRRFGLMVAKLRGAQQLRWRFTAVNEISGVGRHSTWERIEPLLQGISPVLAQWYVAAQELALVLNAKEQAARYECKVVERLMAGVQLDAREFRGNLGRGFGGGRPKVN